MAEGTCATCGKETARLVKGDCKTCYNKKNAVKKMGLVDDSVMDTEVTLDFKGFEALLAAIQRLAKDDFRPLEWQVIHMLKQALMAE